MRKTTARVNYSKIENKKGVTENVFTGLKQKSKVRIKHFKVKVTGVYYVWGSMGYQGTSILLLTF